jgi:hypothetical protein
MTYRVTWHSHWTVPEVYGELTKVEADELVREGMDRQYRVEVIEEKSTTHFTLSGQMEWTPPLGPADYIPDWDRYMKADNS